MKFFRNLFHYGEKLPPATHVVLYTRKECHLCEVAKDTLLQYDCIPEEVDIDEDPQLRSKFDCCVPVVEIDGKIRFRGHVDKRLLKRLL